jgi:20S proteasome alpha/beta subunit
MDERFIERITAKVRQASLHGPASLGTHAAHLPHGTTIGAFFIEGGARALVFSDGKVSMGSKPVHLAYRKIFTVDRFSRLAISGSPVLGAAYAASMKAWIGYREDTSDQPVSARAKSRFLGRLLMSGMNLMHAGIVCAPIFVTFDAREKKCARIFMFSAEGSEIESDTFSTSGSGTNVDVSLIDYWKPGMSLDDGVALARRTILGLAPKIDSFSGGKISIDLVGPEGAQTLE